MLVKKVSSTHVSSQGTPLQVLGCLSTVPVSLVDVLKTPDEGTPNFESLLAAALAAAA